MTPMRLAITGIGMVTPWGLDRDRSWQGLLSGKSAIRWLSTFRSGTYFGGEVPCQTEPEGRLISFARRAAAQAVQQSGLAPGELQTAGCVFGTSKIEMTGFDRLAENFAGGGVEPDGETVWRVLSPSGAAAAVARDWGCEAALLCPVAACATGLVSLLRGADLIRSGHCPVVIAGSADAALHPGLLNSYRRLGVLARPGDDPAGCCRPFDRDRTGFAVGEGGASFVLEDWNYARARGATLLAEFVGGELGSDVSGLTSVDASGDALAAVVTRLLRRVSMTAEEIDCVSLHGTATRMNDEAEAAAMRTLFQGCRNRPFAFGLKGAIGHLMGAAGAVEAAASVLSLERQTLLPTCNVGEPDGELGVTLSKTAKSQSLDTILKVSLGFGGHVAAGIFRRVERISTQSHSPPDHRH